VVGTRGQFYLMLALAFAFSLFTVAAISRLAVPRVVTATSAVADAASTFTYKASAATMSLRLLVAGVNPKMTVDPNTGYAAFDRFQWDEAYMWCSHTTSGPELWWDYGDPPPSLNFTGFIVFRYLGTNAGTVINFTLISTPLFEKPNRDQRVIAALDFPAPAAPSSQFHSGYAILLDRSGMHVYAFNLKSGWDAVTSNPQVLEQTLLYNLPASYTNPAYSGDVIAIRVSYTAGGNLILQEEYGAHLSFSLSLSSSPLPSQFFAGRPPAIFLRAFYATAGVDSIVLSFDASTVSGAALVLWSDALSGALSYPRATFHGLSVTPGTPTTKGVVRAVIQKGTARSLGPSTVVYDVSLTSGGGYTTWAAMTLASSTGSRVNVTRAFNLTASVPGWATTAYTISALPYFYVIKIPISLSVNGSPVVYFSYYTFTHFKVLADRPVHLLPYVSFVEKVPLASDNVWYVIHLAVPEDVVASGATLTMVITTPEGAPVAVRLQVTESP